MMKKRNRILKITGRFILAVSCQLPAVNFVWACPLCVESTPYKHGLQWAVLFLLPIPFVLAGTLFWWVRRHFPPDSEES